MNKSVDGRVKRKHAFQVELTHSKKFSKDRGEDIMLGVWSAFEAIVLEEVCSKCNDDMVKLYNDIVYYSQTWC